MQDSLSIALSVTFLVFVARIIIYSWLNEKEWKRIVKRYKETDVGRCPRCCNVHPEAVHHDGFHDFWTRFECPKCDYRITIHIDKKGAKDNV